MVVSEIIPTLRQLNRSDQWQVMRFLVSELSKTESSSTTDEARLTEMIAGRGYEVWSPEASVGATDALMAALAEEKELASKKRSTAEGKNV